MTVSLLEEALYSVTNLWTVEPPVPSTSSWVGLSTNSGGVFEFLAELPGILRAASTAA